MTMKQVLDRVISEADVGTEQSAEFATRVYEFINRALLQMCIDAPNRFFEDTVRFATRPDGVPTLATDLISISGSDPYVFAADAPYGSTGALEWQLDHAWDGRNIDIQGSDDVWRTYKLREVWLDGSVVKFTLDRPWINATESGASYRVYDGAYYLPDDMVRMRAMALDDLGNTHPLTVIGQDEAEGMGLVEVRRNISSGQPEFVWRRGHFQLISPTDAPTATAGDNSTWVGPERAGEFRYLYTYGWGYRDEELQEAGNTTHSGTAVFQASLWESSPSPYVSVTVGQGLNKQTITFPDIAYELGFRRVGEARHIYPGYYINVYRQRRTSGTTPGHADTPSIQSTSDQYYLIGRVFASDSAYPTFVDTGAAVPDKMRPLRRVSGYEAVQLYPYPDERYMVDVRCVRRPQRLEDPYDALPIDETAIEALVYKVTAMLLRQERMYDVATTYEQMYNDELFSLANTFGDLRPNGTSYRRGMARADRRSRWKRWYKLS